MINKKTHDEVHYAELASNEYWKYILQFMLKFMVV